MNTPQKITHSQKAKNSMKRTTPILPNIVCKCLLTLKGVYAVEISIGTDLGLLIQILGQFCYIYTLALV